MIVLAVRSTQGHAFIYPVWWTDCPARLKGWFDRVWTVGFAVGGTCLPTPSVRTPAGLRCI
ncbi:NAD(P)H-dependent oxidoreductase [Actinoallomurus iriomotensis]|uniref:Flavodoxin-like fold domain-containing protein n=1 Tax=Actinoallomurus iriomotensis TaxID=478107 RepID=A0A9W6VZ60_9ACTN|nr:hypothetical protein Airi02_014710 [Actinoallomurus iriomotensis]